MKLSNWASYSGQHPAIAAALQTRFEQLSQMTFENWISDVVKAVRRHSNTIDLREHLSEVFYRIRSCMPGNNGREELVQESGVYLLLQGDDRWHPCDSCHEVVRMVRQHDDKCKLIVHEVRIISTRFGGDVAISYDFYPITPRMLEIAAERN